MGVEPYTFYPRTVRQQNSLFSYIQLCARQDTYAQEKGLVMDSVFLEFNLFVRLCRISKNVERIFLLRT
jgi:hypothetical protein